MSYGNIWEYLSRLLIKLKDFKIFSIWQHQLHYVSNILEELQKSLHFFLGKEILVLMQVLEIVYFSSKIYIQR